MKHFTIPNRQGLLTRSYGKAVPISSKGAAALDGRQTRKVVGLPMFFGH